MQKTIRDTLMDFLRGYLTEKMTIETLTPQFSQVIVLSMNECASISRSYNGIPSIFLYF